MNTSTCVATKNEAAVSDSKRNVYVEPVADVYRSDDGVRLILDLPGVKNEDLEVQVQDAVLKVEARSERANATRVYRRSFRVDRRLDSSAIEASLKDGVLEVKLPVKAEAQARRIDVVTA